MSNVRMTYWQCQRHLAEIDGRVVSIKPCFHRILEILILRGPRWTTWPELIRMIYPDPNQQPVSATDVISVGITQLRNLGVEIANRYGFGYRLRQPDDPATECRHRPVGKRGPNTVAFEIPEPPPKPKPKREKKPKPPKKPPRWHKHDLNPPGYILGEPFQPLLDRLKSDDDTLPT